MGRARGRHSAVAVAARGAEDRRAGSRFDALFGARRSSTAGALLEGGAEPSPEAAKLLARYQTELDAGQLSGIVALLREHEAELAQAPRLQDLLAMLSDRLHAETMDHYSASLTSALSKFGADAALTAAEQLKFSKAVASETGRALMLEPRSSGLPANGPEPTPEEMLRGRAEAVVRDHAAKLLLARVAPSGQAPDAVYERVLGEVAYKRLSQEAAGVWGDEWPLQDLFDEVASPPVVDGKPTRSLTPTFERVHWREFFKAETAGWAYGAPSWGKDGTRYPAQDGTQGLRGETRYALARLTRKRIRAHYNVYGAK